MTVILEDPVEPPSYHGWPAELDHLFVFLKSFLPMLHLFAQEQHLKEVKIICTCPKKVYKRGEKGLVIKLSVPATGLPKRRTIQIVQCIPFSNMFTQQAAICKCPNLNTSTAEFKYILFNSLLTFLGLFDGLGVKAMEVQA